ncbi:hypothetical protein [Thermocrispum agreste]|uniref:hypothetical protein n=1 Tax=Thermocrispum agreste TaxID=37925 RepID=UPI00040BCF9C|nr:hypothetical protein [Thermocrispum agreste]
MDRTVRVESVLNADADAVWERLQRTETVSYVLRPWIRLPVLRSYTDLPREGDSLTGWLFLLGLVPLGRYTITVAKVDPASRTLRSEERGGVVRRWQHTLHAEPAGPGRCRYTDTVLIDTGMLTPVVAKFARWLFRYRHRRWSRLVRRDGPGAAGRAAKGESE